MMEKGLIGCRRISSLERLLNFIHLKDDRAFTMANSEYQASGECILWDNERVRIEIRGPSSNTNPIHCYAKFSTVAGACYWTPAKAVTEMN
jgi:hypothetical protein